MRAQIYKIHSDFYYAKDENNNPIVCKIREILKKQKTDIMVGDFVRIEDYFIISREKRKNALSRPKCANIDLMLIVASLHEPELDFVQLNRYLCYLKYHKIDAAICFNKIDLDPNRRLKTKIYETLGYKTFFVSAKTKEGIKNIEKFIKNKTIALTGMSGVGKTTLINALISEYGAKTREVSRKTQKGRHTTRHVEIIEYKNFKILDTPGFSCLKFDFLRPDELLDLFDDIKKFALNCKYSDCLHRKSKKGECSVWDNIDKIDPKRYESYLHFLDESLSYREKIKKTSIKEEKNYKTSGSKTLTKISKQKRTQSRKTLKQNIEDIEEWKNIKNL